LALESNFEIVNAWDFGITYSADDIDGKKFHRYEHFVSDDVYKVSVLRVKDLVILQ
jgi:hypothetical protein